MNTRLVPALFACAALLLPFAGCSFEVGTEGGDEGLVGQEEGALVGAPSRFYLARRDHRTCPPPLCGGYYLKEVNHPSGERYVSRLDLPRYLSDQDTLNDIGGARDGELILEGSPEIDTKTGAIPYLRVWQAFRGMPGVGAATPDSYFQVKDRDPPIACLVAPCNNELAYRLNSHLVEDFTAFDVTHAAGTYVDTTWLDDRVRHHDAVVSARYVKGDKYPGGYEVVLDVSQVFVKLPVATARCDAPPRILCPFGHRGAYVRDADRCLVFDGCMDRNACAVSLAPTCDNGYEVTSWPTRGETCVSYACDPTFTLP